MCRSSSPRRARGRAGSSASPIRCHVVAHCWAPAQHSRHLRLDAPDRSAGTRRCCRRGRRPRRCGCGPRRARASRCRARRSRRRPRRGPPRTRRRAGRSARAARPSAARRSRAPGRRPARARTPARCPSGARGRPGSWIAISGQPEQARVELARLVDLAVDVHRRVVDARDLHGFDPPGRGVQELRSPQLLNERPRSSGVLARHRDDLAGQYDAKSLARNTITFATSKGSAARPKASRFSQLFEQPVGRHLREELVHREARRHGVHAHAGRGRLHRRRSA